VAAKPPSTAKVVVIICPASRALANFLGVIALSSIRPALVSAVDAIAITPRTPSAAYLVAFASFSAIVVPVASLILLAAFAPASVTTPPGVSVVHIILPPTKLLNRSSEQQ